MMNKTIQKFLDMPTAERQAYLLDTPYRITVTKGKVTNKRRQQQIRSRVKSSNHPGHKDVGWILFHFHIDIVGGHLVAKSGRYPKKDKAGYMNFVLYGKTYGVHRIVWMKYSGVLVPKGHEIHHKNKDRSDNRIDNLELVETFKHRSSHAPPNQPPTN